MLLSHMLVCVDGGMWSPLIVSRKYCSQSWTIQPAMSVYRAPGVSEITVVNDDLGGFGYSMGVEEGQYGNHPLTRVMFFEDVPGAMFFTWHLRLCGYYTETAGVQAQSCLPRLPPAWYSSWQCQLRLWLPQHTV